MTETTKKFKNTKKIKNRKAKITRTEFKRLLDELTDEEINQVSCWLSARQQKP